MSSPTVLINRSAHDRLRMIGIALTLLLFVVYSVLFLSSPETNITGDAWWAAEKMIAVIVVAPILVVLDTLAILLLVLFIGLPLLSFAAFIALVAGFPVPLIVWLVFRVNLFSGISKPLNFAEEMDQDGGLGILVALLIALGVVFPLSLVGWPFVIGAF